MGVPIEEWGGASRLQCRGAGPSGGYGGGAYWSNGTGPGAGVETMVRRGLWVGLGVGTGAIEAETLTMLCCWQQVPWVAVDRGRPREDVVVLAPGVAVAGAAGPWPFSNGKFSGIMDEQLKPALAPGTSAAPQTPQTQQEELAPLKCIFLTPHEERLFLSL